MIDGLLPFQVDGVKEILRRRRLLLADDMGLGKSLQAIGAIDEAGSYPALIVCPAGVKINWQREIQKWLPDKASVIMSGRKCDADPVEDSPDFVICNYDILPWRHEQLTSFAAIIFDESHCIKTPGKKRTEAALKLIEESDSDIMKVMMSGTPLLNHPHELITQLTGLGYINEFGDADQFTARYCPPYEIEVKMPRGWKKKLTQYGARNIAELRERLYSLCMLRRTKEEVLPQLPAKRRVSLYFDGSKKEMAEYRKLVKDGATVGSLRKQIGLAKVAPSLEWLGDHPDQVVVFVHHRDVGEALVDALGCPAIRGGMSQTERQKSIDAFSSGNASRIVCSIQAAGVGINGLQVASNALFVEQAWTPALLDQAEDRLHRMGQVGSVTAWYTIVPDTIDEIVFKLLRKKAAIVNGAMCSIEEELVKEMGIAA